MQSVSSLWLMLLGELCLHWRYSISGFEVPEHWREDWSRCCDTAVLLSLCPFCIRGLRRIKSTEWLQARRGEWAITMDILHIKTGEHVQPRTSSETCGKWNRLNFQKYTTINKLLREKKRQREMQKNREHSIPWLPGSEFLSVSETLTGRIVNELADVFTVFQRCTFHLDPDET